MFFKKITQAGNKIIIKGFPIRSFSVRLSRRYKTSRLKHLYESLGVSFGGKGTIKIHVFFLPELVYLLRRMNFPVRLIQEIINNTWLNKVDEEIKNRVDISRIKKEMHCTPLHYQLEFLNKYDLYKQQYQLFGYLLSLDQGLGKTLTALMLMTCLRKKIVIIVAPNNTLNTVWVAHIKEWYKSEKKIFVANEGKELDTSYDYYIFNYEAIPKLDPLVRMLRGRGKEIGIIIDESHNFLRLEAARTTNVVELRRNLNCEDMLPMSGTPLKNAGLEIIPILLMIDKYFDAEAMAIFKKAFGLNTNIGTDILSARLSTMMYRKIKEDVIKLPQKTEEIRKIKMRTGKEYTFAVIRKEIKEFIADRLKYHNARKGKYESDFYSVMDYLRKLPKFKNDPEFKFYLDTIADFQTRDVSMMNPNDAELVKRVNEYEKHIIIPALPAEYKKKFNSSKAAVKYLMLKINGEVIGSYLMGKRIKMTTELAEAANLTGIVDESIKKTVFFTSYVNTIETVQLYFVKRGYKVIAVYGKTSSQVKEMVQFSNQ